MSGVEITTPRIGTVFADSPAATAGFVAGETIRAVDGDMVDNWADVRLALIDAASARRAVTIITSTDRGVLRRHDIDFSQFDKAKVDGDVADHIGLSIAIFLPRLGPLLKGEPAIVAGLRKGDELVSVEALPTPDWKSFTSAIRARPGMPTHLQVRRDGRVVDVTLTPKADMLDGRRVGRIGAAQGIDEQAMRALVLPRRYGPIDSLGQALRQTWRTTSLSLRMMWRMVIGHVSVKQISGPVAIADYAGQSAQLGLQPYLEFLCLISISLGILNLMPIPVLDGGHLMYYSAELLRGRPLSVRTMELGQRVGVVLLAVLMSVALFNDISRLVGG
jgi:regulator of sigma E protease